ncbi:UDP-N-acetylmuramate--L-alanine ligase [soil metagenome]
MDTQAPFRVRFTDAILTTLDLVETARRTPIHFMGIGGAGMAPLAELVLRSGGRVTGCDAIPSAAAERLAAAGVEVVTGHAPGHVDGCAALIVTSAVPPDHPEIVAARQQGIPVLKRAQALGSIVNRGTVVGIAGTHGKTTTTALTTAALAAIGLDPTGLVGGRVPAWGGNLRPGSSRYFVVEADEFDRSFLTLRPRIAVVTTLEADHLDIYGSLAAVYEAFHEFVDAVPDDGLVVACADDHGVGRLLARTAGPRERVLSYGSRAGAMLRIENVRLEGSAARFDLRLRGTRLGAVQLQVPGMHNIRNATAAAAVAHHRGGQWKAIAEGLASYSGVDRRFEHIGEVNGIRVVDDYAHHPTEIVATLRAARAGYPESRVVAVFQPHLFSRTRDFSEEFGRAMALADLAFVTDIYPARETPIPGVTGELVAEAAWRGGAPVGYLPLRGEVARAVAEALRPGDLCLTLGAGDLNGAAREIVSLLTTASSASVR